MPGSVGSLPTDTMLDILSRVPAEYVLECKLVCKTWGALVDGSSFTNMHLRRQLNHLHGGEDGTYIIAAKVDSCIIFACRIDDPGVFRNLLFHGGQPSDRVGIDEKYIYNENLKRIYHPPMRNGPLYSQLVGSCNGLICMFQIHHLVVDPIYICNPLTREYVYLPELVVKKEDVDPGRIKEGEVNMYYYTACGFGYVRLTNEYKVVRIHYLNHEGGIVEVYTLGSGCGWRAIGKVSYQLDTSSGGRGTYANDVIYWTAYNKVVAFDLADEKFQLLSVPSRMENRQNGDTCELVALGRHLCLYVDDKLHVEIWSLLKSRDSEETWCMGFDINYEALLGSRKRKLQPILLTKKGEIILLYADSVLYCYDRKTTILKMISNEASTDHFKAVVAIAHVNTFASLKTTRETSKRYTVHPHRVSTPSDDNTDELDRLALGEDIDTTHFTFGI